MQENLWKVRVKGTKRKEQNHNFVRHWSIPASYQSIAPSLPSPHKSICHINFCRFSLLQTSPKSVNPCTPPPMALLSSCSALQPNPLFQKKKSLSFPNWRSMPACHSHVSNLISFLFCSLLFFVNLVSKNVSGLFLENHEHEKDTKKRPTERKNRNKM